MKASSVNLETEVYLDNEEIRKLKNSFLSGVINFREYEDNKTRRKIPFIIIHDKFQDDLLNVKIMPRRTYFGEASEIVFVINNDFYDNLTNSGSYGGRFLNSGKMLMHII
ncbi:MAG TPA: hypothetical protein VJ208_00425 [Candidatus Nanoarchaeia archaeon]|nr:hypothetical protein [Candidatus Nanoarchaeia archaeon]